MSTQRWFQALRADEALVGMEKIAKDSSVPLISVDGGKAEKQILDAIEQVVNPGWTHPQVAVSAKEIGDLKERGFKKTRMAIPLPGERLFTPTWRKGKLHAHRVGKHYLFHKDAVAPTSLKRVIKHNFHDVPPAVRARIRKSDMRFKLVPPDQLRKVAASNVALASFQVEFQKIAESGGHWRRLPAGQKGHDQFGNEQAGRTWVTKNRLKGFVKLKAHQADFAKKVLKDPTSGHIAAHGTGTGKTVSAIATFEKLKGQGKAKRALVIAPAGLRKNFHDSVGKFTGSKSVMLTNANQKVSQDTEYVVVSYSAFRRNPQAFIDAYKPDTLIADEFHRAGNPDSSTHKAIAYARTRVPNVMGLTASIAQNDSSDAVPLVNLVTGGKAPIKTKRQFHRQHTQRVQTAQRGVFGGKVMEKRLKNKEQLYNRIGGSIHYIEDLNATEKPPKHVKDVAVPMSSEQLRAYKMAMKGVDPALRRKISLGIMLNKREEMNAFTRLQRAQQISNSMHLVNRKLTPAQSAERTPKIKRIMDDVQKHLKTTSDGKVIIYTNLVKGGVDVISAGLTARGIEHGVFAGKSMKGMTEERRQQDVEDYKAGKKKVIIITGAGAEGLSLGNTTMVALADPHYNPERMNQAAARGIRAGGQSHRPLDKRGVIVNRYVTAVPKNFWQTITFQKAERSVGQYAYMTADRKSRNTRELRDVLQQRHTHEQKKRDSRVYRWFGGGP